MTVDALHLDNLSISLGGRRVVAGIDLTLEAGAFFALLGPSGCGKSTLLNLIAGYRTPSSGQVIVAGHDVTAWPPERRDIGMVFQSYALFPHLSARDNVSFGLEMRGVARAERQRRVEEMLERVGLSQPERGRKPAHLSGGQQQRVAVARALVIEPRLLLLDEPLANLDRRLREQMRIELRELQRRTGVTTLLVTHDQEEALALADRIGVMFAGRLLQVDSPRRLYHQPRCPFVACFLGDANLLEVVEVDSGAMLLKGGWRVPRPIGPAPAPGSRVMVRPEQITLAVPLPPTHPSPPNPLSHLGERGSQTGQGGQTGGEGSQAGGAIHFRLPPLPKVGEGGWGGEGADAHVLDVSFLGADVLVTVNLGEQLTLRVRSRISHARAATLTPGAGANWFDRTTVGDPPGGAVTTRTGSSWMGWLLATPTVLLLVALLVGPLLLLFRVSVYEEAGGAGFYRPDTWTLAGYRSLIADNYTHEVLLFTVLLGLGVTFIVLLVSYPLALFIYHLSPGWKTLALAAVILPKLASVLVVLYGLQLLLSSTGPINRVLLAVGAVHEPVMLYRNLFGVVLGEAYLIIPYSVLVLVSALERIDPELSVAARGLGAGPWQVFRRITWPLSRSGLVLAGQLSLIWALGALLGPVLMGSPQETTLAVEVQHQTFERNNWPRGAATAVLMSATLIVCLILILAPLGWRSRSSANRG